MSREKKELEQHLQYQVRAHQYLVPRPHSLKAHFRHYLAELQAKHLFPSYGTIKLAQPRTKHHDQSLYRMG
jgi:hypothetical protein